MLWDKEEKFRILTRQGPAIVSDLGANLAHYRDRYALTLENQRTQSDDLRDLDGDGGEQDFRIFYDRFYTHIAEQLRRTDARLAEYQRVAD